MIFRITVLLTLMIGLSGCPNPFGESALEVVADADKQVTVTYNLSSSSSYTYTASKVAFTSGTISVNNTYTLIDDFSDNNNTLWSTILLGGTNTSTETSQRMDFDCNSNWAGLQNTTGATWTDYIAYSESTLNAWETGTQVVAIYARVQDNNNLYMGGTWNNTHYVYRRNGGTWTMITSVAGFATATATTYATKLRVNGNALEYKIWDTSGAEPGAYQISTTDGTSSFASGQFGLACYRGDGYWDNARAYDVSATTEYWTDDPTVLFPATVPVGTVYSWDSISLSTTESGSDDIRFDISLDGGSTYLTYSGGDWITNSSGYSGAISASVLATNFSTLPTSATSIILRAYLHSNDGSTTPSINSATFVYTYD